MPAKDYYLPERRLVSQEDSAQIESARVPRARFTGAWTHKTTFDAGWLIPFLVQEVLPGDHMKYRVTAYIRMGTALFPIFDEQRVDTFFFFVPNRLVWDNWKRFMGEQANPADTIAFTIPQWNFGTTGHLIGTLGDYFGLPLSTDYVGPGPLQFSVLPARAYTLIYNEWFRDQNSINSATLLKTDGPDNTPYALRKRAKAHDYFTSALPWPQKFTAPSVPVAGLAPIQGLGSVLPTAVVAGPQNVLETARNPGAATIYANYFSSATVASPFAAEEDPLIAGRFAVYADLSQATGVAINTFRLAWMTQSFLELDARGGTRYTEKIRAHFDVVNPDFRLQRPEYIGGGQTQMQITPIAQTAPTTGVPLGALGGTGTAAGQHTASYAATEHGYIIGIINIRQEISYQNKIDRHWKRLTQYDFYFPSFAGLGEQAILRGEIMGGETTGTVFGYQERWQEYRTQVSEITGKFRSSVVGTLDAWHLGERFLSAPVLGQTFLEVQTTPVTRALAAGAAALNQQFLADILIQREATRPIPMFGTPATMGRF